MVDALIIVFAVVILVTIARRPRPVRPATAFLLALLAGVLLWANLRATGRQEEFGVGVDPPAQLDPVTKALFWRGWPLAPCMVCNIHSLRFRPEDPEGSVLVFDGGVFVVTLFLAKVVSERCLHRCKSVSPTNARRP